MVRRNLPGSRSRWGKQWNWTALEDRVLPSVSPLEAIERPLTFEANVGQSGAQVQFLARGQGYGLFLTPGEAVLNLYDASDDPGLVLRARIVGADLDATATGLDPQITRSNYYIGNDPSQWHTDVPHFGRVLYDDVYPGIDLVYYGTSQHQLEYDFVVAPGADPSAIRVAYEGAQGLHLDAAGNLVLATSGGEVVQHAPIVYQEIAGVRQAVAAAFVLEGNQVGFQLGAYDPNVPLTIDPVLVYSTYHGGSGADDNLAVAVYNTFAYVTGYTRSANFPFSGTGDNSLGGSSDAFMSRYTTNGNVLIYSTYFGGGGRENDFGAFGGSAGIATDYNGNVFLTGFTQSADFPLVNAFDSTLGGTQDAFVAKINIIGTLLYSTYLGGSGAEAGNAVHVNPTLAGFNAALGTLPAYVTGWTDSADFSSQNPLQATLQGPTDAFVTKLGGQGNSLVFSTYLGGTGDDTGVDIAVDSGNNAYITGRTLSINFPTTGGLDQTLDGTSDAFVTRINSSGSAMLFSTYLGGSGDENLDAAHTLSVGSVAVDLFDNAYITGATASADFPTFGAFDASLGGTWDAFVTKLDASGATVYGSYLGGSGNDVGQGIVVDGNRNAFLTGSTESADFPTQNPTQASLGGTRDAFVTGVDPTGFALAFSTFLGGANGTEGDIGRSIALDYIDAVYVAGFSDSTSFPTQNPRQAAAGGSGDGFVTKLAVLPGATITWTAAGPSVASYVPTDVGAVQLIEGGSTDTYQVVLTLPPTANVVITINADAQQTTSPLTLTFTPANWNVGRTVTVTAVDDAVFEGNYPTTHTGTITHTLTSADPNYNGRSIPGLTADILDNETPSVILTNPIGNLATTLLGTNLNETGPTSGQHYVSLTSIPAATVTVTLTADAQVNLSQTVLTFTPANWYIRQIVTVTAVDDATSEGFHSGIISHSANSADPVYQGIAINNITASITDNDNPGFTMNVSSGSIYSVGSPLHVVEGGPTATATYTLVLLSPPSADVMVTPNTGTQLLSSPTELTFTPANWNVRQTVTITGFDDAVLETTFFHTATLTHTAASADPTYNALPVGSLTIRIADNETAGIVVTEDTGLPIVTPVLSVNEAGPTTDTYRVFLTSIPTANVLLTMTPSSQVNVAPAVLTFTATNWYLPQTVNVIAVDDGLIEGAHTGVISTSVTSADAAYNGRVVPDVTTAVIDDDFLGVLIAESTGSTSVSETGPTTDIYQVRLGSLPSASVTITVNGGGQVTGSPSPLTFTPATWNVWQLVTITAVDDFIDETAAHTHVITHLASSSDTNYNGIAIPAVTATIADNDTAGVTVAFTGGATNVVEAGATDSYTIVLDTQPSAPVVIAVSAATQVTVSPTSLTFSAANWNIPQNVTVTALNDGLSEGIHTMTITHSAASADSFYNVIGIGGMIVGLNDPPGLNIIQTGGNTTLTEGAGNDTYTVALNSQPTANVIVTLNPGTQVNVSSSVLTFTNVNWNIAQTVTVTGINDGTPEGLHTGLLAHSTTSADLVYNALSATITANLNDLPGVNIIQTGAGTSVIEGETTDTYTVWLNSQPTTTVVVTLTPVTSSTLSANMLTFTTTNWGTPRVITLTAVDDLIAEGTHASVVTHTAASADPIYNGIAIASLTATINDNDVSGILLTETDGPITLVEGSGSKSYNLRLLSPPTSSVTVTLAFDPTQVNVSLSTVTFSTTDWNVPRPVVVSAVRDSIVEGYHHSNIVHTSASVDPAYNNASITTEVADVVDFDGETILGTSKADQIVIAPSADLANILVTVNNKTTLYPAGISQLLLFGQDGADNIQIVTPIVPVVIVGGLDADRVFVTGRASNNAFVQDRSSVTVNGVAVGLWGVESLVLNGKTGNDTFTVADMPAFSVEFKGDLGVDSVVGPDRTNLWNVTTTSGGTLNRTVKINGIEDWTGGSGADTFQFATGKLLKGRINGGAGANILDYSACTSPVAVDLLQGAATGMTGFQNIGTFKGGRGSDRLSARNVANTWDITGLNTGTVDGVGFQSFENLTGGAGDDLFRFADGQGVKGKIDGGTGSDSLDFSSYLVRSISINLQLRLATNTGGFANIERFVGSATTTDTLLGASAVNAWYLNAGGNGSVGTATFIAFDNLTGGSLADTFNVTLGGDWIGLLSGGGGTDLLVAASGQTNTWGSSGTAAGMLNGRKFVSIETRR